MWNRWPRQVLGNQAASRWLANNPRSDVVHVDFPHQLNAEDVVKVQLLEISAAAIAAR
jgi:hypothetical protein